VGTGRLETFADGVFAIAATLLILNVDTQVTDQHPLASELARAWALVRGLRGQLRDHRDDLRRTYRAPGSISRPRSSRSSAPPSARSWTAAIAAYNVESSLVGRERPSRGAPKREEVHA
jgi:transmembrane protein TMEM174 (potassium channel)